MNIARGARFRLRCLGGSNPPNRGYPLPTAAGEPVSAAQQRPLTSEAVDRIAHVMITERLRDLGITVTQAPMSHVNLCRYDEDNRTVTVRETAPIEHKLWALRELYRDLADPNECDGHGIPDPQLRLVKYPTT
jgi:hypothetical protein